LDTQYNLVQEAIKENEEEPEMTINTSAGSVGGMARVRSTTALIISFVHPWRLLVETIAVFK
jgi:hypothetical protein